MKKILLVDGFGLIFKAYYAFINNPLRNKDGENVSAVFGFFKSLLSLMKEKKPDFYLVALESDKKCFRNEIYPDYKAHRPPAPDDLKSQIVKIIDLLDKFDIPHFFYDHYEADDIIGTLSTIYSKDDNNEVMIMTADKDLRQLINKNATVYHPGKKSSEFKVLNEENMKEEMGILPGQLVDYLALIGDKSDNIPGVAGVGDKTAVKLLNQLKSLDGIYDRIGEVSSKSVHQKLVKDKENAYLSRELAIIKCDVPIDFELESLSVKPFNLSKTISDLSNDGMKSLISDIRQFNSSLGIEDENGDAISESEISEIVTGRKIEEDFIVVNNFSDLDKAIDVILLCDEFSFDLETQGFDFVNDKIIMISFSCSKASYVVPLYISEEQRVEGNIAFKESDYADILKRLERVFSDEKIVKIAHNIKFDLKFLKSTDINVKAPFFDTMIAEYCIDSSYNTLKMKELSEKYLNYSMIYYKDLINSKKDDLTTIPFKSLMEYSGQDSFAALELFKYFRGIFQKDLRAQRLFYEIEMPLTQVLIEMEFYGVGINTENLKNLSDKIESKLNTLYGEMRSIANEEFNPNSTQQLRKILFEDLKLPVIKKTKTGPSTDVDVLNKLVKVSATPLPSLLLEHRTLSKIKSTYSDSLPEMINKTTKRIHTTYMQTGTQTGRLSSKDPNLQNIPIRSEIGREIRKAFIPLNGNVLLSADYSQIELFLLAEFSKDEILFKSFEDGIDIHKKTASILFGIDMADVTKSERSIAKTVNFGILYGQSPYGLSEELNITVQEAHRFIETYFDNYSGVKKYIEKLKDLCEQKGYSETYWGRRRTIPEIYDKNKIRRSYGERMAVNTAIQGTAADLIKISMIRINKQIESLESKLLMQVHDELIFDVVTGEQDKIIEIIRNSMENGFDFELPLKTSIEVGKNWGELH